MSFWSRLQKPFSGLAPMDGITDFAFREIVAKYAKPDVLFTEFINVQGLFRATDELINILRFSEKQRPIIAQLFGKEPEYFKAAAKVICELGFDGVDINMGCPAKQVASHGSGSALMNNPDLSQKIINATKSGIKEWLKGNMELELSNFKFNHDEFWKLIKNTKKNWAVKSYKKEKIPVSVKTRIKENLKETLNWVRSIEKVEPEIIIIHGRTPRQMYSGKANWDFIGEIANNTKIPIIGNGDVLSHKDGVEKCRKFGTTGFLIGRAALGNPFVFSGKELKTTSQVLLNTALEHAELFEKVRGKRPFFDIRKHLAWYVKCIHGAAKLRVSLMNAKNINDVEKLLET